VALTEVPAPHTVTHPAALDRRDDARVSESRTRLGIRPMQGQACAGVRSAPHPPDPARCRPPPRPHHLLPRPPRRPRPSPACPPLQEVMAFLFDTSQGRVNAWIHTLSIVLQMALGEAQALPERDPKNLEQTLALCLSVDFIIDGTERRIQRPHDASHDVCL